MTSIMPKEKSSGPLISLPIKNNRYSFVGKLPCTPIKDKLEELPIKRIDHKSYTSISAMRDIQEKREAKKKCKNKNTIQLKPLKSLYKPLMQSPSCGSYMKAEKKHKHIIFN